MVNQQQRNQKIKTRHYSLSTKRVWYNVFFILRKEIDDVYLSDLEYVELTSDLVFAILLRNYTADGGMDYVPSIYTLIENLVFQTDIRDYLYKEIWAATSKEIEFNIVAPSYLLVEEIEADEEYIKISANHESLDRTQSGGSNPDKTTFTFRNTLVG